MTIPRMNPVRYSMRSCPKGWSLSAGLPDNLKPINVTTDDPASERLLMPSAVTDMLPNRVPAVILARLRPRFTMIPMIPAKAPYPLLTAGSDIFPLFLTNLLIRKSIIRTTFK